MAARAVLTRADPCGQIYLDVKINRHCDIEQSCWKEPDVGSIDSFKAKGPLEVGEKSYEIFRLAGVEGHETLPYSLKVLLENLLRTEDGANITADHIRALG